MSTADCFHLRLGLQQQANAQTDIYIGDSRGLMDQLLAGRQVIIVTDENVSRLYQNLMPAGQLVTLPAGESSKSMPIIVNVAEQLLDLGCDRKSFILGFGGGVVSDISGFVASIYLRGVDFGFVCTTLLAQADAGLGGKNGINLGGRKNLLGCINQPSFIVADPLYLQTLSHEDFYSGLAEVIKHALIRSPQLFHFIFNNSDAIKSRQRDVLCHLIRESVKIKAAIVQQDPGEKGERKILNFGHSYGHAIELYHSVPHGYAVAHGIRIAAWISRQKSLLSPAGFEQIIELLRIFEYPDYSALPDEELLKALSKDKKHEGDQLCFVLLKEFGKALYQDIPIRELVDLYHDLPQFS